MDDEDEQQQHESNAVTTTTCSVAFKGRAGHCCRIQAKQTTTTSSSSSSGEPATDDILPPEDGVVQLKISVRIDEKRMKRETLRNSGILQAIRRFFSEHKALLRIVDVGESLQDPRRIPLQMAPVDPALLRNITRFRRLECIKLNLSFCSAAPGEYGVLKEQLSRFRIPQVLEHTLFRGMVRLATGLAKSLPLVFNATHARVLLHETQYLPSISKSVQRMYARGNMHSDLRHSVRRLRSAYSASLVEAGQADTDIDVFRRSIECAMSQIMRSCTKQKKLFPTDLKTPTPGSPVPGLVEDSGDDGATTIYGLSPQRTPQTSPSRLRDRVHIAGVDTVRIADMENVRFLFDDMEDEPVRSQQITDFLDQYEDEADKAWAASKRFPLARGVKPEEYENGEDWLELIEKHEREASDASGGQRQGVSAQRSGPFIGLETANLPMAPQLEITGPVNTVNSQTSRQCVGSHIIDNAATQPDDPMSLFDALDDHEDEEDEDVIFLSHSAGPESQQLAQSTQDSGFVPSQPLPVPSRKRARVKISEMIMEAPAQKMPRMSDSPSTLANKQPQGQEGGDSDAKERREEMMYNYDESICGQSVMASWDSGKILLQPMGGDRARKGWL